LPFRVVVESRNIAILVEIAVTTAFEVFRAVVDYQLSVYDGSAIA